MSSSHDSSKSGHASYLTSILNRKSSVESKSKRKFLKTSEFDEIENKDQQGVSKSISRTESGLYSMILPKVMSLAARLLPTVADEMKIGDRSTNSSLDEISIVHLKTNGMNEEELKESCTDEYYSAKICSTPISKTEAEDIFELESGLRFPKTAGRVIQSSSTPKAEQHNDWGLSPVSPFASAQSPSSKPISNTNPPHSPTDLDLEFQLKEREFDELVAIIKNSDFQTSSAGTSPSKKPANTLSSSPISPHYDGDDSFDMHENDEYDDYDDLKDEISRLNDVAATLRTEMQDLQFETLPIFEGSDQQGDNRRRFGLRFPSLPRPFLPSSSNSLSRSEEAALQLKTFRTYFGSGGVDSHTHREEMEYITQESLQALYWAIAMIWAMVILLAGHFEFKDFKTWGDIFDWLFSF